MKLAVLILLTLSSVVAGHLLLKIGVTKAGSPNAMLGWLLNWRVASGLAMFGLGVLSYMMVLRLVPLNVAQGFFAAQFVGVILASHFVLGEELTSLRVGGMVLIVLGIVVVAWSQA